MARTDADICTVAAPILKQAATEFGEAVFVSRFRQNGVAIIHVETPSDPTVPFIHPGLGHRPMHACSCSKAIAAFADVAFRDTILKGPMKSYTDKTHTSPADLEAEFEQIAQLGFAECVEEIEVGVSSVAAPVSVENIGAVFSLGTTGPIRRFTPDHRHKLGTRLIDLAQSIGEMIALSGKSYSA